MASVLEQCNLIYETFSSPKALYDAKLPVIFCDESCDTKTESFLFTNHCVYSNEKKEDAVCKSGYYFSMDDSVFGNRSFLCDISCYPLSASIKQPVNVRGSIFDRMNHPVAGTGIVFDSQLISFPFILADLKLGDRLARRPYYSQSANKHYVEIGPSVDFAVLRRLLFSLIQYAYMQLGLNVPYENANQNMDIAKKYFSIRIDADGCTRESTEICRQIAVETGCSFTWFLDMETWKKHRDLIASLIASNQDVQLHCYHHMTYLSKETNLLNLRRGLRHLRQNHIRPVGIVSPFGFYTSGFAGAISELNMLYSSEFAYNVDDKPSYAENQVLQLPIHCGSIGTLQKYGFSDEEIFADFEDAVREAAKDGRVGVIYDHPVGRMEKYASAFISLIQRLKADGFEYLNYTEYAQLWKEKRSVLNASMKTNKYENLYFDDIAFVYPPEDIMGAAYEDNIIQLREAAQLPLGYFLFEIKRKIAYLLGIR